MLNYKTTSLILLLIATLSVISCERDIKFDKNKWSEQTDPLFPSSDRPKMLKDLTTNYKLVGVNCSQITELLGKPDFKDSTSLIYKISVDYGSDIDPIYTKNLQFFYSKDSLIKFFKVVEWKKQE